MPNEFLEAAPRGMWYELRVGRGQPFIARWREPGGVKGSRSFETADDRALFAVAWEKEKRERGRAAVLVSPRDAEIMAEFREITGGADPLVVAHEWVETRAKVVVPLTVGEACERFEVDQAGRAISRDSHSHRRLHARRIVEHFGVDTPMGAVDAATIDGWIRGLVDEETGEPMAPKTRAAHLKSVHALCDWMWRRRLIGHNPCLAVTAPEATVINPATGEAVHRDIRILTVEQAGELFAANRNALCVGRLALEAFGGLRYTSAKRLRAHHIDWKSRGIEMPGHLHKSGRRHFVQGWPANLWKWLRHAPDACWELSERMYLERKREAFERAGLKPGRTENSAMTAEQVAAIEEMRNVLRHSFATYHLAAFRKPDETLELMTKTSRMSLNHDYRGRATRAAGIAYFRIVP